MKELDGFERPLTGEGPDASAAERGAPAPARVPAPRPPRAGPGLRHRPQRLMIDAWRPRTERAAPDGAQEPRAPGAGPLAQDQELLRAEHELDEQREKYFELFDRAPVGYLTLDGRGIVDDANFTAAQLLGVERRRQLIGHPFGAFVVASDAKAYRRHRRLLEATGEPQTCELRLRRAGAGSARRSGAAVADEGVGTVAGFFWARLESRPRRVADGGAPTTWVTFSNVDAQVAAADEVFRLNQALEERVLARTAELAVSGERLAAAIEGSGAGLVDLDLVTGEAVLNDRWAAMVGYTLAELLPTTRDTWTELCHPDDLPRVLDLFEKHLAGQLPMYECEARIRHRDGHWVWTLGRAKIARWDRDGRPLRMIGTFVDITARKLAEEALRASEERFRAMFEEAPLGVALCDSLTGRIYEANERFAEIVGRTREAMATIDWMSITHPDDIAPDLANMARLNAGEIPGFQMEKRYVRPDGSIVWIDMTISPVRVADPAHPRHLCMIDDITEWKELERALVSSEANFRAFFDTADDIICVGSMDGRIVYANPAASRKLGYAPEELTGMRMVDLGAAEDLADAESVLAAVVRGATATTRIPMRTRTGTLLPAETRGWVGRWNGMECVFSISRDLSAEQEAQQRFERLFRHNPALMAVSDMSEVRFTDVNDAWLATLGYSREEVIGRTSEELRLAVDPGQQQVISERLVAEGRFTDVELQVRQRDGAILDGLFSGEIIESLGQQYFLTVMVDQTERRRAQEALRASEAAFSEAQRIAHVGSWTWDSASDLVTWSDEMFRIYGLEPSPTVPPFAEQARFYDAATIARIGRNTDRSLETGEPFEDEYEVLRGDGSVRHVEARGEAFTTGSGTPGLRGTAADVTELRDSQARSDRARAGRARKKPTAG